MPPSRASSTLALLACGSVFVASALGAASSREEPDADATPEYVAARIHGEIRIDGVIDEAAWKAATRVTRFWEWTPGRNTKPPVETEFLLGYDDHRLYVAARAADPAPNQIRAHLMDRDAIETMVQDDYILLMVDSFSDHRRAFQFRVNPRGIQADALNGYVTGSEDWSWDLIWESRGRITAEGYEVEMAIPFSQLPFPAGAGPQGWRISLGRSWPRDQRHRMASYVTDYSNSCGSCTFNLWTGFEGMEKGRGLELLPTVTGARTDARPDFPAGELVDGDEDADLGLSGRWSITPSSRMSFALNPDFSQVEADAAQLDVNERFALFFPEQRPFFLEGVDLFQSPIRAVFTRTIVDPDWGLKYTTKAGRNAFGLFATRDAVNNVLVPSNQGSRFFSSRDGLLRDEVSTGVARYRRDIGRGSALGVLYTGREADDYSNHLAGVDGAFRFAGAHSIGFQYLKSETRYPGGLAERLQLSDRALDGDALNIGYSYFSRDWYWNATYRRLDEEFRADAGFVPRVDVEAVAANLQRTFWLERGPLVNYSLGANASRTDDLSGRMTDRKIGLSANLRGPRQSSFFGQIWTIDKRSPSGRLFEDLQGGEVYSEIQPSGAVKLSLYAAYEDEVDFVNDRRADLLQLAPSVELKLGKHVAGSVSHTRRAFELDGATYLQADLTELRVFYHFDTRSFVRAIIQRTQQKNDPALFASPVEEELEDVFGQFLFSYRLNAETLLYVGYSETRFGIDERFELTRADRTFFVKVAYAFAF